MRSSSYSTLAFIVSCILLLSTCQIVPCVAVWDYDTEVTSDSLKAFVRQVNFSIPFDLSIDSEVEPVDPLYTDFESQGLMVRNQVTAVYDTLSKQNKEDYANSVLFASLACTNTREPYSNPPTPIDMINDMQNYFVCYFNNLKSLGWAPLKGKAGSQSVNGQGVELALDILGVMNGIWNGKYQDAANAAVGSLQQTEDGAYSLYKDQSQRGNDNQFETSSLFLNEQGFPGVQTFFTKWTSESDSWQVLWVTYKISKNSYDYISMTLQQTPAVWDDEFRDDLKDALGQSTKSFVKNKKIQL